MAEQRGFHQRLGDRAAIDGDERLGAALAGAVDRARDQFLAGAGFALDQRRDVGGRGFLGGAQHWPHRRRARDHVGECQCALAAALDAGEFAAQRARLQRVAQADLKPLRARRLDDEVRGAGAHCRHHIVDAAVRGLHDHRDGAAGLAHLRQHAEPVEIRHHQIEHHAVDAGGLRSGQESCRGVAAVERLRSIAEALHHGLEQPALNRIVIDDENAGGHDNRLLAVGSGRAGDEAACVVPNWCSLAAHA